ncbi:MAG: restriction endonuclease subunit S [Alphaproteobacteria bacterium]|nr:restriction endonuclease subunit S [Alphaproteobacteria bacterium]
MTKTLSSIATAITGITLREKPLALLPEDADALLMQLSDLDTAGAIQAHNMIPVRLEKAFERFIAKPGDIVFRGRGAGIAAAVMPETLHPVIVVSPLIVIRPNRSKVDAEYLAWTLTTESARRHYAEYAQGSAIIGIGKQNLETLEIPLPPLQTQQKIGKLMRLQSQEFELVTRYQMARAKLLNAQIRKSIHQEQKA